MAAPFRVSLEGITVLDPVDTPVNVTFDDQRVWSFLPARDTERVGMRRLVPWPKVLQPHLVGTTRVELVIHDTGAVVFSDEVTFGRAGQRLTLRDDTGNPLAVDKSGRLQRTFSETDPATKQMMAVQAARVISDLTDVCGLDAYVTYGSLLGAVRAGHMIGHDSDVDVGYLSRYTHPFDVIRENRRAAAAMTARGWRVVKMSSANFKVWIPVEGGRRIGIDVFASFHIGDHFHVMASKRGKLDLDAIVPLSSVALEGVEMPAPADPARFLEYLYGQGWRTPDPAFKFGHPAEHVARMGAWFRPSRRRLRYWADFYASSAAKRVPETASPFAGWVDTWLGDHSAQSEPPGRQLVDLGCGTGRDSIWFVEQGYAVTGFDLTKEALQSTRRLAERKGVSVRARFLNLEDTHQTLITGARIAHRPTGTHIYARGLLDNLSPAGRASLWRFASMAQRRGGYTFLEFRTDRSRRDRLAFGPHARTFLDPDSVIAEIASRGGTVADQQVGRGLAPLYDEDPHICRLVVRWNS
jgi:hypothetical protein